MAYRPPQQDFAQWSSRPELLPYCRSADPRLPGRDLALAQAHLRTRCRSRRF